MLREEKETALREIQNLRNQLEGIEKEMGPLQVKNSELESQVESLTNENTGLKQDITRWRTRAAALLEKSNKINPEEWKKLQTEKDTLTRQLTIFQESSKKQQAEIARQVQQIKTLQQQVSGLTATTNTLTQEKRQWTDESKKNNDEKLKLKTENDALRAENTSIKNSLSIKEKEAVELNTSLARALSDVEEQRGIVKQVRLRSFHMK